ncbi:MAG: histidinol-phosphatase HisJ family protein [Eubacteriales bacterium]|nr:histidinol-phosphatase HisJ family protein [Eubacteriales bacterium]
MFDYHLHSSWSCDSHEPMPQVCAAAEAAGLKYIAMTDHMDELLEAFHLRDTAGYLEQIDLCRAAYPSLTIARGLELDYHPECWASTRLLPEKLGLDFALVSVHYLQGKDPYYPKFYEGREQHGTYLEYLQAVDDMAKAVDIPCTLGHITYISKFAPYEHPLLRYADYSDLLDDILKTAVQKGLALEINTSGLKNHAGTLPETDVLRRYRQLGGELLTVGSDAHQASFVGYEIAGALERARAAGFAYITTFSQCKPQFHKL